jgi:nitrogen regulatory protein PII
MAQVAKLKLVFFIIDWGKLKALTRLLEEAKVRYHYACRGRGTAAMDILNVLGIGQTDKSVVLCLEEDGLVPDLLKKVNLRMGLNNAGAGIAFTIPLSSVNLPLARNFKAGKKTEEKKTMEIKHDLIISIFNQGFSDDVMAAAREAGAAGGTVINARGTARSGPVKFFGISVQNEKEMIIILTSRARKNKIMEAICTNFGVSSEARGVVFSLPVDSILGLDLG